MVTRRVVARGVRFSVRADRAEGQSASKVRFSVRADRAEGQSASKVRFSVTSLVQDAPFREGAGTECAFP